MKEKLIYIKCNNCKCFFSFTKKVIKKEMFSKKGEWKKIDKRKWDREILVEYITKPSFTKFVKCPVCEKKIILYTEDLNTSKGVLRELIKEGVLID